MKYVLQFQAMYSSSNKKRNTRYLFQHKLSQRNETGTNHHGLLSTSVCCLEVLVLRGPSTLRVST